MYKILSRTIRRRIPPNKFTKLILGEPSLLEEENKIHLVNHISLKSREFAPATLMLREIAYNFAPKLGLQKKRFSMLSRDNGFTKIVL